MAAKVLHSIERNLHHSHLIENGKPLRLAKFSEA